MIWFAICLKTILLSSLLAGAGTALSGWTLKQDFKRQRTVFRLAGYLTAIAAVATTGLVFARLNAGYSAYIVGIVLTSSIGAHLILLFLTGLALAFVPLLRVPAALLMPIAFGIVGHAPSHEDWLRPIIALHVMAAAWWLGSILWLWSATRTGDAADIVALLQKFSKQVIAAIALMILAGIIVGLTLITDIQAFLASPYSVTLFTKLSLVVITLVVALYNRLRLTPDILAGDTSAVRFLRLTLLIETILILTIILATAVLTTAVSPFVGEGHNH